MIKNAPELGRRTWTRSTTLTCLSAALIAAAFTAASLAISAQAGGAGTDIPVEELMKPGELKDLALGPADAKVTIVEYASMTCGHCARFHKETFPKLKEKYIDTGKVRFVLREFPLDPLAAAASMLARCAGGDKTYPLTSILFEKQLDWARENPIPKLLAIAKQAGFTKETFEACLKDQTLLDKVTKSRERAANVFGVKSTPTFFVNGKRVKGAAKLEDFGKVIDPLLEEKK